MGGSLCRAGREWIASTVIQLRLLLCAAILACGITSASATMRIVEDHGGQVGKYLQAFAKVRATGERVIIDGDCMSACTMVLGLVPSKQLCVTPRARFGFHAASMPNDDGRLVTSGLATEALWGIYPLRCGAGSFSMAA